MDNQKYVVLTTILKQKALSVGSKNLSELEETINEQAQKGYRLHSFTTSIEHEAMSLGGKPIQVIMVFEKID